MLNFRWPYLSSYIHNIWSRAHMYIQEKQNTPFNAEFMRVLSFAFFMDLPFDLGRTALAPTRCSQHLNFWWVLLYNICVDKSTPSCALSSMLRYPYKLFTKRFSWKGSLAKLVKLQNLYNERLMKAIPQNLIPKCGCQGLQPSWNVMLDNKTSQVLEQSYDCIDKRQKERKTFCTFPYLLSDTPTHAPHLFPGLTSLLALCLGTSCGFGI